MYRHVFLALMIFVGLVILTGSPLEAKVNKKCLILNSYHEGYSWSDDVQRAASERLLAVCDVSVFYLDTKRHSEKSFGEKKGREAKVLIESSRPDIVIAIDDPASEFVVAPFFKGSKTPFVFCGVNWGVEKYAYPYTNATGMIEITPIRKMLKDLKSFIHNYHKAIYISGDVSTDHENFEYSKKIFAEEGIELKASFVKDMGNWKKAYQGAQEYDLILFANHAGIKDWSEQAALDWQKKVTKKLVLSNTVHMIKYAMLSIVKLPAEQGDWAAKAAIEIMGGMPISKIPIVTNRQWDLYLNEDLMKLSPVKFPMSYTRSAIKVSK